MVQTPIPIVSKFNEIIHTEPYDSILYGIFWIGFLSFWTPIALFFLMVQCFVNVILWYFQKSNTVPFFDPKNQPEYDLAIVITGCDTGFGKDLAIYSADAGYTVFAGCYNHIKSKEQFATFTKIQSFQMDVTKDNEVENVSQIVTEWLNSKNIPVEDIGRKRVLYTIINNAGVGNPTITDWCPLTTYQKMMDVNCFGIIRVVKAFLPIMKQQVIDGTFVYGGAMRIINIISVAAYAGSILGNSSYATTKHAAQAFTDTLREELVPFRIAVTSVNPSFHSTPIVTNLEESVQALYHKEIPKDIQTQYGPSFFDSYNRGRDRKLIAWNPIIVVEQIMNKCIRAKEPPYQLFIGFDAKTIAMIIFRMLPPGLRIFLLRLVFRTPTPEVMMMLPVKTKTK